MSRNPVTNPVHKRDKILLKTNEVFHWEGSFEVQESLLIFSLLVLSSIDNHFLLKYEEIGPSKKITVLVLSLKRYTSMARSFYEILWHRFSASLFSYFFCQSFLFVLDFLLLLGFFVCLVFFTSNWKAKNKLLYHDLSIAFSIGTLTVGYLSFCWEGIDFLSLLLGKPCFHLFHWLNVLIIRSQVYAWGVAPVMIKFSGQINTTANVCGT